MTHNIHLADRYEGHDLDSIVREVDGGFKLVAQTVRISDAAVWTLVTIENPETIFPNMEAARAVSVAALKLSIDGGFA